MLFRVIDKTGHVARQNTPRARCSYTGPVHRHCKIWHDNCRIVQLDVTATDLEQKTEDCVKVFGKVDVLLNNVGYGYAGPVEDSDLGDAHALFETLFWGPVRATKTLLPHMRQRGHGTIVNISSAQGIAGTPGIAVYNASKHALEGMSEAPAGGIRTELLSPSNMTQAAVSEAYKGTSADFVLQMLAKAHGTQAIDPARCAKRIVEAVDGSGEGWPEDRFLAFAYRPRDD